MQREAKITSKGQITVPLDVRKLLGVKTGDKLLFASSDRGIEVKAVREAPKVSPFTKYVGIERKGKGRSIKQIVNEIRKIRGR